MVNRKGAGDPFYRIKKCVADAREIAHVNRFHDPALVAALVRELVRGRSRDRVAVLAQDAEATTRETCIEPVDPTLEDALTLAAFNALCEVAQP